MPKKHYNLEILKNELEDSAFFRTPPSPPVLPTTNPKPQKAPEPAHTPHVSTEPRKRGNTQLPTPPAEPSTPLLYQFDRSMKADQKYTLAFTEQELEIIEDIKLELRRKFSIKTSKVELVRCGLGELIEDFQKNGDHSRVVTRLRTDKHKNS